MQLFSADRIHPQKISTRIRPFWKKCPREVIVHEKSPSPSLALKKGKYENTISEFILTKYATQQYTKSISITSHKYSRLRQMHYWEQL